MTGRTRTVLVGAAALVMVLVAVASVLVWSRPGSQPAANKVVEPAATAVAGATETTSAAPAPTADPTPVVREYFDALARRDAERARSLILSSPDEKDHDNTSLLTAATLRDPGYRPPTDVRIGVPNNENGTVRVEVTFSAGGSSQTLSLPMQATGDGWRIGAGLSVLSIPTIQGYVSLPDPPIDTVVVAGTPIAYNFGISSPVKPVMAFPGDYLICIADHPNLDCVPSRVAAGTVPQHAILVRTT
jgi:hypothetical protein